MTYVLFWDIDGTLLSTARAGIFAFEEAAREVCGAEVDFSELHTAGLTDALIAGHVAQAAGVKPAPETVTAILRSYERHLPERLHWRKGHVLPRVLEVLEHLRKRPDVRNLLLTGNTVAGARTKLTHYGLDGFFEGGAFCLDASTREEIARRALEEAAHGDDRDLDVDRLYVIGDTPYDVHCGKAIGARTVAVASGPVPIEDLRAAEPWLLLEELPEPAEFERALGLDKPVSSPA